MGTLQSLRFKGPFEVGEGAKMKGPKTIQRKSPARVFEGFFPKVCWFLRVPWCFCQGSLGFLKALKGFP